MFRKFIAFCLCSLFISSLSLAFEIKPFTKNEIKAENLYGFWEFTEDLIGSEAANAIELQGRSRIIKDDIFTSVLESFDNEKGGDTANGAFVSRDSATHPDSAFTLEAWVKLKETPENPDWTSAYIVDKSYIPKTHPSSRFNKDYFLMLRKRKNSKILFLQAGVGLGEELITFSSSQFDYEPEVWRLFSFYYDGKGTGMFFLNGKLIGKNTIEGKGASVKGRRQFGFADRTGSNYAGLPGYLAQARLVKGISNRVNYLALTLNHPYKRNTFERMEENQKLTLKVDFLLGDKLPSFTINYFDGLAEGTLEYEHKENSPLAEIELPLPCHGKAGKYTYKVKISGQLDDTTEFESNTSFDYELCARLPEFMPIVLWGSANLENVKNTGFTHSLVWMDHLNKQSWDKGEALGLHPRYNSTKEQLNEMMSMGLRAMAKMGHLSYFKRLPAYEEARQDYLCYNRDGSVNKMVNFSLPRVQQFAYDAAKSMSNNISMFPQVDLILNNSEFRDGNQLSFRPEDYAALQKDTGMKNIPEEIRIKNGVKYHTLKDFPANRIIPENDPILTYYRWFWGGGDGYADSISEAWRAFQYSDNVHWKVLWDPAVRCPSKWGSGGNVDIIGQWTYTYPDPLVMSLAADELFAMLKGGPAHQVAAKMTQIIWYRSGTAGTPPKDPNKWAEWEKRVPDAKFLTIPPDIAEIALWQKLSRPITAILYHGAASLWDSGPKTGYSFTNEETEPRLAGLFKNVVKPLGPTLLKVPDRESEIAVLQSFTSQMFYGDASFGNMRHPAGRAYAALLRAHYQPEIIYDETILKFGLDKFKILVMPSCAVLSEKVAEKIIAWQNSGGIIVADDLLAPGITPDVLFTRILTSDKELSYKVAEHLRSELDAVLQPYAEADSKDAILRVRSYGTSDYLFAFNDNRTYGEYLGQYRRVMEKGLPLKAKLEIKRKAGAVYNLLTSTAVKTLENAGKTYIDADFSAGQGQLYLITEKAISEIKVSAATPDVKCGESLAFEITVLDSSNQPIDAVIPLDVRGFDSAGDPIEINGYYAAVAGKVIIPTDIAVNDRSGKWSLKVKELASGKEASISFNVINNSDNQQAGISLFLPENNSVVSQLSKGQKEFFALPAAERREFFADQKKRLEWRDISYIPRSIKFSWLRNVPLSSRFTVRICKTRDFKDYLEVVAAFPFCEVYNLETNQQYFWQVHGDSKDGIVKSEVFTFKTADESPRLLYVNEVENLRDLGGRKTSFEKRVKQNMIFRSIAYDSTTKFAAYKNGKKIPLLENSTINDLSKNYLVNYLGIKTDLDLRAALKDAHKIPSPLGPEVKFKRLPSKAYATFFSEEEKENVKNILEVFLDEANYPIIFHCFAGQDRTGAVAFILEALLGVSKEDLFLDWEASALWNVHVVFRHEFSFDKLLEEFEKLPGKNYCEKAEAFVKNLGFKQSDIDKFRKIMLE